MTSHTGIPTIGPKGLRFRSRLEARWAWTFDSMRWDWHYEPLDLKGYIPDFIVAVSGRRVLVEVKGALGMHESSTYKPHVEKIHRSGWDGYYMAIGADPTATVKTKIGTIMSQVDVFGIGLPIIGVIGHTSNGMEPRPCTIGMPPSARHTTETGERWILMPKLEKAPEGISYARFVEIWTEAQNASQWKAPIVPTSTPTIESRDDLSDVLARHGEKVIITSPILPPACNQCGNDLSSKVGLYQGFKYCVKCYEMTT